VSYNAVADNTSSIFIHLAVVASQICEISRNSPKIRTYSSLKSSILVSIERPCNFLFVINNNFVRISCRFRYIDALSSKLVCFLHPTLVRRPLTKERTAIST